ncbi:5-hydroxytryptamine receptor 1B-like [Tachypleus tridentatus]|uniref:5-hydroxytryptamine receptor 1B-like n=1 Tax=Tachypleus tridentatus TaxID=6853 RepID=UPI003FD2225D
MSHNVQIQEPDLRLWDTAAAHILVNQTATGLSTGHDLMMTKESSVHSLLGLSFKDVRQELQTAILFLIFIGSVMINSMVFLLFYKKPTLRTFSNRFVLNLSLTHLLQAVIVMPYIFVSGIFGEWPFGHVWCQISGFVFLWFSMETVFSLVLIAVDRNCAVNSPLHYSITITKKKTGVFISGTWFLAFVMCLPPFFGITSIRYRESWHACAPVWTNNDPCIIAYSILIVIAGFVVPLVKLNWSYCSMFMAAKSSSARTRRHIVGPSLTEVQVNDSQKSTYAVHLLKKKPYRRSSSSISQFSIFGGEWKAVKTGSLVIFSFVLCWLPLFLVIGIEPYMEKENWMPVYCPSVVILLSLSASIINPYLYVFRNRTTFAYAKQLFHCGTPNKDVINFKSRPIKHHVLCSVDKPTLYSKWAYKNHQTAGSKTLPAFAQEDYNVNERIICDYGTRNDAHLILNIEEKNVCHPELMTPPQYRCQQRPLTSSYYELSPASHENVFTFHIKPRSHLGSSSSETTYVGGTSIDSMEDNVSLCTTRKFSRRSTCAAVVMNNAFKVKHFTKPIMTRTRSLEESEVELMNISSMAPRFNHQRRKSLPQRRSFNYLSSESTLTSTLSTDSQNSSISGLPFFIFKIEEGRQLDVGVASQKTLNDTHLYKNVITRYSPKQTKVQTNYVET